MRRALVAILVAAAMVGIAAPVAAAGQVEVVVRSGLDLDALARQGAVGLLVPGSGESVTRAGALSSLVRGRTTSSLMGGISTGEAVLVPSRRPGSRVTVYVELPAPGRTPNTRRYPVAIVGDGYEGMLVSRSTRIPGLVSIADIAPTVTALRAGERPPVAWRAGAKPVTALRALDHRLAETHDARDAATTALVVTALVLAVAGLVLRSSIPSWATIAAPFSALGLGLVLSALEVASTGATIAAIVAGTGSLALLAAIRVRVAASLMVGLLVVYLAILVWRPSIASLAVIGPHPESGGRYFGVTNLIETIVLAGSVALVAAAPALAAAAVALLCLVLVGWSEAGADGGGILVLGAAYAVVLLGRRYGRLRPLHLAVAGVAIVLGGVVVVLLDRLAGGSSHVTKAVGDGPVAVLRDVEHRLDLSWHAATNNLHTILLCVAALLGIALLLARGPRPIAAIAIAVALAVSILVNDSPPDVLVAGALGLAGVVAAARAAAVARPAAAVPPIPPEPPGSAGT